MSPILFKIHVYKPLKEWTKKWEQMRIKLINEKYIFNLHFADNQVVIDQDEEDIEYLKRKFLEMHREWGLNINCNKTENF